MLKRKEKYGYEEDSPEIKGVNRRVTNKVNKKYRRHLCDIWGRLANKNRGNFLTRVIFNAAVKDTYRRGRHIVKRVFFNLKKKPYKKKNNVFSELIRKEKAITRHRYSTDVFVYQINRKASAKTKKPVSMMGLLLKRRRQISLYYGGGRIRKKTFRRYGLRTGSGFLTGPKVSSQQVWQLREDDSFICRVESRIDVLLFRCNFVDTIYRARQIVFYGDAQVQGFKNITNPAFLVKVWRKFRLRGDLWRKCRISLFKQVMFDRIICFPAHLYINFATMRAFQMHIPLSINISYPFATAHGLSGAFRKLFMHL